MTDDQRRRLQVIARSTSSGPRTVVQARALVLAASGLGTNEVARRCHTTNDSVRAWRRRFETDGVDGVGRIAPGRGRTSWLPVGTEAAVVHDTVHERPGDGARHWTTRRMAERFGISKDTVARIWRRHDVKPWTMASVEGRDDPDLEELPVDAAVLRRDPPERAVASMVDETTALRVGTAPGAPASRIPSRR
jgi:putative transposase